MLHMLNKMFHFETNSKIRHGFVTKKCYFCRCYEKTTCPIYCARRRTYSGCQGAAASAFPIKHGVATRQANPRMGYSRRR